VDTKKNLGHRFIHKKGLHNSESRIPKGKNLLNGSGDEVWHRFERDSAKKGEDNC